MSFYSDWLDCINRIDDDSDYLEAFLNKKSFTTYPLQQGELVPLKIACDILLHYDITKVVEFIDDRFISDLSKDEIVQFSNFDSGTKVIVETLYHQPQGMTFTEIGSHLADCINENASLKYGENHAKLANSFELVNISNSRPRIVTNTSLGEYFHYLTEIEKDKLIQMLLLRDPVVLNIIAKAKKGSVSYDEVCSCIAPTTRERRKGNLRRFFDIIFGDKNNNITYRIKW